ncbi:MAG: hypothetical protein IPG90_07175 [Bacteroidetes bacterium]|nr:hypothetical protein [Bacteroidota bacterium]
MKKTKMRKQTYGTETKPNHHPKKESIFRRCFAKWGQQHSCTNRMLQSITFGNFSGGNIAFHVCVGINNSHRDLMPGKTVA